MEYDHRSVYTAHEELTTCYQQLQECQEEVQEDMTKQGWQTIKVVESPLIHTDIYTVGSTIYFKR